MSEIKTSSNKKDTLRFAISVDKHFLYPLRYKTKSVV